MKKQVMSVLGVLLSNVSSVYAAPDEVFGYLRMSVFDYHTRYFDEAGHVRIYPKRAQIDLTADQPEPQYLFAADTPLGNDIVISFAVDEAWSQAIYKVAKTDALGNPANERELIWQLQDNTIVIDGKSVPLTGFNGLHEIVVRAHGYKPRFINVHLTQKAPKIFVANGRQPTIGQELTLKLKDLNYRFKNPVYEVAVDNRVLADSDYRVVANLVTINDYVVKTPGVHFIKLKAWGYETAKRALKFARGYNSASSALPTESGDSNSLAAGPYMNAAVVFDFDLVSNAYILQALGYKTRAIERIIDTWENTEKTMVRSKKGNINAASDFYRWEDYTYAIMEAEVEDQHLTFDNFVQSNPVEYQGRPYQVKFMLADGHFGEAVAFNQAIAQEAPELEVFFDERKGVVKIRSVTNQSSENLENWLKHLERVKVGATQLWGYEYAIEESALIITSRERFILGNNRITLMAKDFRDVTLDVIIK
ncbi:hemoblobin-interacting domain-containing protein [Zooshikella sp. RANM57]|uniref:hemoblobin-interacting domain-containing protein n=1 Tax=Zooshikella sp. RANM57 TaxID=3425863 RepID=UPI003D6FBB88